MSPLKPLSLTLLAVLAAGENHGYGIYQQAIVDVQGSMIIYERSVYRELARLFKSGLIAKVDPERSPVRYRLTPHGRRILIAEKARTQRINQLLRERL